VRCLWTTLSALAIVEGAIFWCWSSREKKEKKRKKRKEGKEKKRRGKGEKEGERWTCLEYKYFT